MVSLDSRFVLDCAGGVPSAVDRFRRLRGILEPLYLSVPARAAVVATAADRDAGFQRRVEELLGLTEGLDIDPESIRYAAEIADALAREGRRMDGVDLFVAASARQHRQILVTRNPLFGSVPGLECESY